MSSSDILKVHVSKYAESENSWKLLVDHSDDRTCFSRAVWIPKKITELEKNPDDEFHYILSAPRWLLDKNTIKYYGTDKNLWKSALKERIAEATKMNQIGSGLKKISKELIDNCDSPFELIYSGSRMTYVDIIFRGEISKKTLYFILKTYGTSIFFKISNNKRLL
jgi:hypothetical protein